MHNSLSDTQKLLQNFICRLYFNGTQDRTVEHCDTLENWRKIFHLEYFTKTTINGKLKRFY